MNKNEFASIIKTLGIAFNKEVTKELLLVYYEALKDENIDVLKNATKETLLNNKFFPTIAELVEKCDKVNKKNEFEILEKMKNDGYFKDSEYSVSEYEKAYKFLETGIIPDWFKEDMKNYEKQKATRIEYKEKELINIYE